MDFRLNYGRDINKGAFLGIVNLDTELLVKNKDIRGYVPCFSVQLAQYATLMRICLAFTALTSGRTAIRCPSSFDWPT